MKLPKDRRVLVLGAAGVALLIVLAIVALAMRGPIEAPEHDLSNELADAFSKLQTHALPLVPPAKVSRTVIAQNGTPERNAPDFAPRKIYLEGAAPLQILSRPAVLVAYRADPEGNFAVLSFGGKLDDVALDAGTIEFENRRFTTFVRKVGELEIHGVGAQLGGRLVFVIGTQRIEQLAAWLSVIPQV